ncbi:hypothetical protein AB0L70_12230 [Kribbella sp. NPDC051952]|uniref:hypothetical protein n=1 Tax=Kribbella sp. NPDC051952 TaxID=3154851 RepID=UPI0034207A2A
MSSPRSTGHRVVALAVAATLIAGGTAGLSTQHGHHHPLTVLTSGIAIVAGLAFLRQARKGR